MIQPGDTLLVTGAAIWGAVGWRFRGGAFSALTGLRLGTQVARLMFGAAWMSAPAILHDWHAAALVPALLVALMGEGWAGYMAMGHEPWQPAPHWPYDEILRAFGLRRAGFWRDAAGMTLCGLELMALPALAIWWCAGAQHALAAFALALAMPLAYWLPWPLHLPLLGRWIDNRIVWGEVLFGAALGAGLTALA